MGFLGNNVFPELGRGNEPVPGWNTPWLNPPDKRPTAIREYDANYRKLYGDMLIKGAKLPPNAPEQLTRRQIGHQLINTAALADRPEVLPANYSEPSTPSQLWNLIPITPATPQDLDRVAKLTYANRPNAGPPTFVNPNHAPLTLPVMLANRRWTNAIPTKPWSPTPYLSGLNGEEESAIEKAVGTSTKILLVGGAAMVSVWLLKTLIRRRRTT